MKKISISVSLLMFRILRIMCFIPHHNWE